MSVEEKTAVEIAEERVKVAIQRRNLDREALDRADREVVEAELALAEIVEAAAAATRGEVKVHFADTIERERATFHVHKTHSLQSVWDKANVELEVPRRTRDILQAVHKDEKRTSLMTHLGLSLEQAEAQGLCGHRFEIATGTGGA